MTERKFVLYNGVVDGYAVVAGPMNQRTMRWEASDENAVLLGGNDVDMLQMCLNTGYFCSDTNWDRDWHNTMGCIASTIFQQAKDVFKNDFSLETFTGLWYIEKNTVDGMVDHTSDHTGEFELEEFRKTVHEGIQSELQHAKEMRDHAMEQKRKEFEKQMAESEWEWRESMQQEFGKEIDLDQFK